MENQNSSLNPTSSLNLNKNPLPDSAAQPFGANPSINNGNYVEGEIYKPSGKFEASGLPLMIIGGALSAVVVGIAYYYISQFIDLIILFPIGAGFIVGALIGMGVKTGKVRSPRMAGTLGVLAGILLVGVMQLMGAFSIRGAMVDALTQTTMPATIVGKDGKPHQPNPTELVSLEKETRSEVESRLTPLRTLMVYESIRGEVGSSIKSLELKGGWFWALEGFEALLLIGTAASIASTSASRPFCENCDVWHEDQELLKVHPVQNPILWEKLAAKDWTGMMQTPVGEMIDSKNVTTISLTHCPKCDCGTISAASTGGGVPDTMQNMQLAPETSRTLISAAAAPIAGAGSA